MPEAATARKAHTQKPKPPVLRSGADSKFAKARGPNDHKWRGEASRQAGSPDAWRG